MKIIINSYEDVDQALLSYGSNQAAILKQESILNEKVQKLKDDFDIKTADLRGDNEVIRQKIEQFCLSNKSDFEKTRSKTFVHGSVMFRTTTPKVVLLSRKYTNSTALELVKRILKKAYIRVKEEINKDLILSDYAGKKLDDSKLASVGLKVDQEERFYIEPDWEKIPEKLN